MKLLVPSVALLLLGSSVGDESVNLRYEPEEGTVLVRVFEARAEYHLADMQATIDGEELEYDELPDDRSSFLEHIAVTDSLGATEDGRPRDLVRTFDALRQENEGEADTSELTSDLVGRKLRFTWDSGEESYGITPADNGDELEEERGTWLAEDMDLRRVLPAGEVEIGDEWDLDPKLYLAFMWPGGLLGFHAEGEDASDEEFARQTIDNLEGSGTARLEALREQDGVRVAVIHVELSIRTRSENVLPEVEEEDAYRPEIRIEVELERELEGTVEWDLEHGHALSAALECEATRTQSRSWTVTGEMEGEEVSADLAESLRYEGTIQYSATITRE